MSHWVMSEIFLRAKDLSSAPQNRQFEGSSSFIHEKYVPSMRPVSHGLNLLPVDFAREQHEGRKREIRKY